MRLASLLIGFALCIIIPLRILGFGYLPPDDAMRHAAYATTTKAWPDVLIIDSTFPREVDPHIGWHQALRWAHRTFGLSPDELVSFAVVVCFAGFTAMLLLALGSVPMWIGLMLFLLLFEGGTFFRILLGRPFVLSMAGIMAVLAWENASRARPFWQKFVPVAALIGASVAIHPTVWYMWLALPLAYAICRHYRSAMALLAGWALGMAVAVLFTGSFYNIVIFPIKVMIDALFQDPLRGIHLVSEFQPGSGVALTAVLVLGFVLVRLARGDTWKNLVTPELILIVLFWTGGFYLGRFWSDWGVPVLLIWLGREIREWNLWQRLSMPRLHQIGVFTCSMVALYLAATTDKGGRYSATTKNQLLTKPLEEIRPYFPDDGGILYSADMGLFYNGFFRFPEGNWRYLLGYEAGMMPKDLLKVHRRVQLSDGVEEAYQPYFERMTPADRVFIVSSKKPETPGFEYKQLLGVYWSGRKIGAPGQANSTK